MWPFSESNAAAMRARKPAAMAGIIRPTRHNAPLAIQAVKISIAQVLKDPGDREMDAVQQIGISCMDSEDFREGR